MAYTTAVRGLSAQGADEFKGMCYSNNDVSFTMTSSEFANSGFKYVVEIADPLSGNEYKFYIAPNAVGSGVFNAKTIFNQLVTTDVIVPDTDGVLLQINEPTLMNNNLCRNFRIRLFEGYDVGGVFTEDESVTVIYDFMCVYGKGKSNFLVMGSNDTKPIALSECFDNTIGFNAETIASRINIPATLQQEVINWQRVSRSNVKGAQDSAYKILSWIADDGTFLNPSYPYLNIANFRYVLYDNAYAEITTFDIPMSFIDAGLLHIPAGLKNLIDGEYITQIEANDTSFWTIVGIDEAEDELTAKYGFYIDEDCKHNPVHVYWLNQKGGWDSYSFIKKNERSIDVEKKRYKTYLGNYNTADVDNPFDTKNYSRALNEREPIVKTFINLTSDWVTESEFKFMKDLFQSKSVWMVDDNVDGYNILPVVVEDTNFLMRRERNSRKYNQQLRLQLANEYDTINISATEYPVPQPVLCSILPVRYSNGTTATSRLNDISPNPGVFPVVYQGVNFGTNGGNNYIAEIGNDTIGTPNLAGNLITGQTYYVTVQLSQTYAGVFRIAFGGLNTFTVYDATVQGNTTALQTFNLVWNPNAYTTGVFLRFFSGIKVPVGSGYNGTITINIYQGVCP
jgi:hypothetical protein